MSLYKKPAHQTLTQFWRTIGADINFGETSLKELSDLEEKYTIKLPHEFREYLRWACPKDVDQSDPELTTWWELERINSLEEELSGSNCLEKNPEIKNDAGQYIVFIDYMILCWAWAICCKPGKNYGRILQISAQNEFVANSFEEFVQSYTKLWDKGLHLSSVQ